MYITVLIPVAFVFPGPQRRLDVLSKEKEELNRENQALTKQLEELKQGS